MTYKLVDNNLTYCALLLGNNLWKEKYLHDFIVYFDTRNYVTINMEVSHTTPYSIKWFKGYFEFKLIEIITDDSFCWYKRLNNHFFKKCIFIMIIPGIYGGLWVLRNHSDLRVTEPEKAFIPEWCILLLVSPGRGGSSGWPEYVVPHRLWIHGGGNA